MKRINIISLFLLLLNYQIDASTAANNNNNTPPEMETLPVESIQSVYTECKASRQIFSHEGGAAGFTSDCVVKVWNGKKPADLSDLSPEQQEKAKAELNGQPGQQKEPQPPAPSPLDHLKLLAEEASNRHYMCMEAKRSILDQLKAQLPAGLNSCDKINEALNNLKLTPLLEEFINKVNGPMKEIVARIHAFEQNTETPAEEKLEAIRKEKIKLTQILDEDCKNDHPSIPFHNISYLPHPELEKVKMTLLVSHPDRKVEFFNVPVDNMGPHIDHLRSMADTVVHHAQTTGKYGPYKVFYMNGEPREGPFAPGVVSLVPINEGDVLNKATQSTSATSNSANLGNVANTLETQTAASKGQEKSPKVVVNTATANENNIDKTYEQAIVNDQNNVAPISGQSVVNNVVNQQDNSAPQVSSINTQSLTDNTSASTTSELSEGNSISNYWKKIIAAEKLFEDTIQALTLQYQSPSVKSEIETTEFKVKSHEAKNTLDNTIKAVTKEFLDAEKVSEISDPNDRYKKSVALLIEAKKYAQTKKSLYEYLTFKETLPDKVYKLGEEVARSDLNTATTRSNSATENTSIPTAQAQTAAVIAQPLSVKDQAINTFVETVSKVTDTDENTIKEAFTELFRDDVVDKVPDIKFYYPGYYVKSKELKELKMKKEKRKLLLAEAIKQLEKDGVHLDSKSVKDIGEKIIIEDDQTEKQALKNIKQGKTATKKSMVGSISEVFSKPWFRTKTK